ncbi:hypothetical protein D3C71_418380 [compost metagenome]
MTIRCVREAVEALRYLSVEERPIGGEQKFNWAHLNEIANDLECLHQPASKPPAVEEGATYRFLVDGEQIEPTDENPDDACQFWIPVDRWTANCKYNSAVLKIIRRRVATPPAAGDFKVDELVWLVPEDADSNGNAYWRATTPFGSAYRIFTTRDRYALRLAFTDGAPVEYDTFEAAKAAAQADYDPRVRASLADKAL